VTVVIRCERCSTMYELDEALLGPDGAPVQCTKCSHVFTAFPPRAAGRTLIGLPPPPPAPAPAPHPSADAPSAAAPPAAAPPAAAPPAAAPPRPAAATVPKPAPRAVRPAPSVYRPTAAQAAAQASPVGIRQPVVRRDAVGAFESRLRWSSRRRWLIPAVVLVVAAVAATAWLWLDRRVDAGAVQARREALALVALDDTSSLDRAAILFGEATRREPKLHAAEADSALARVLQAAAIVDEGADWASRAESVGVELERVAREEPVGAEETTRALEAELRALRGEVEAREEKARALSEPAFAALKALHARYGETPEIARAFAVYYAAVNDREQALRFVRAARGTGIDDPWLAVAEGMLDLREPAGRERALAVLGGVAGQRPELLRARYLLARAQGELGRSQEAVATLDGVLAANPDHEAARRLKAELLAPPPAVTAPVAPVADPPEGKPGLLPRKSRAQPAAPRNPLPSATSAGAPGGPAPAPASVPAPTLIEERRVAPAFEREAERVDPAGGQ
jgi:predicted Zn finger-like uncharacterized protein